jgi:alanine-glyoxylate transaminase/serine-glyoxylate transaminase/serine-pyruvate transaminase
MMDELKGLLRYAFQTENRLTIPISAPASGGMEACFVNLVEPGETAIVCRNGVFGERMRLMAERCGAKVVLVDNPWGKPVDPDRVAAALAANPEAAVLAFVHAETSTGAQTDAKPLAELARRHSCLTIVDTVTSLGGTPVRVDEWGLDAVYSGSQKCLSCTPGLSPLTLSEQAEYKIRHRKTPVRSWFFDLSLIMQYWGTNARRAYHHTAPIHALYGLHEALVMLQEEGLEQAWARHERHHEVLKQGLVAMGMRFMVEPAARLPQLNTVTVPSGADDAEVRHRLLTEFGLEIGAGLGELAGRVWRIGLMGYSSRPENVLLCVGALEAVMADMGADIHRGVALQAVQHAMIG